MALAASTQPCQDQQRDPHYPRKIVRSSDVRAGKRTRPARAPRSPLKNLSISQQHIQREKEKPLRWFRDPHREEGGEREGQEDGAEREHRLRWGLERPVDRTAEEWRKDGQRYRRSVFRRGPSFARG